LCNVGIEKSPRTTTQSVYSGKCSFTLISLVFVAQTDRHSEEKETVEHALAASSASIRFTDHINSYITD